MPEPFNVGHFLRGEFREAFGLPKHNPQDDADAFAQMQRFTQSTGRGLQIDIRGHGEKVYIANHNDEFMSLPGWIDVHQDIRGSGGTFAEAWAKFCAEWPEAGTA